MKWECPDCEKEPTTDESEMFIHRISEHTAAETSGESFNLYDDEVHQIFMEMAWDEAVHRLDDDEPQGTDVIQKLHDMGFEAARIQDFEAEVTVDE